MEASSVLGAMGVPLIADGGIRYTGDMVKALAALGVAVFTAHTLLAVLLAIHALVPSGLKANPRGPLPTAMVVTPLVATLITLTLFVWKVEM